MLLYYDFLVFIILLNKIGLLLHNFLPISILFLYIFKNIRSPRQFSVFLHSHRSHHLGHQTRIWSADHRSDRSDRPNWYSIRRHCRRPNICGQS